MLGGEAWSRNSSPGPAVVQGAVGEEIVAALASNKDITALVSSKVGVAGALVSNSAAAALNPDPCFHRAAAAAITSTPNHSDLRTSTITTVDIAATSSSTTTTTTTTTTSTAPFLDALASLDFKLSVRRSLMFFTASASTGLSELFNILALQIVSPNAMDLV